MIEIRSLWIYMVPLTQNYETYLTNNWESMPQEGIIYGQEAVFAGDNPVNVMREERLACLRENIEYLQQRIQKLRDGMDYIDEKWSRKYKRSINCARPRGFSQKAHCAGRKKK
jgi:hypothetical protein